MHRLVTATILTGVLAMSGSFGDQGVQAAPAPSNYSNIEKSIATIRAGWARPGAPQDPNAPGWNVFFTAILDDLQSYSRAATPAERLIPLNRLYQMSAAMAAAPWQPAQTVREELREWLRPRVRLAWAERRLDDTVRGLPATKAPPCRYKMA